jgi:2,3-bisphosphoglycerate-dependent phosphoglycerate mutase
MDVPHPGPPDGHAAATRVFAIRHGETDWNTVGRIQGHLDLPLNANGRQQAARLGRALAGEAIDAVVSSDLLRARETADAVARGHGLAVATDTGLRERGFGIFEGLTHDEIVVRWPEAAARWRRRDPAFGADGGEVLNAFHARCIAAATRICALHPGRTVVLVAHGGVMDCLYRAASRIALDAPRSWQLGNASINRLLFVGGGFTLVGWDDDHHLADPALDESAEDAGTAAAR